VYVPGKTVFEELAVVLLFQVQDQRYDDALPCVTK
jgi:hypothetical protein